MMTTMRTIVPLLVIAAFLAVGSGSASATDYAMPNPDTPGVMPDQADCININNAGRSASGNIAYAALRSYDTIRYSDAQCGTYGAVYAINNNNPMADTADTVGNSASDDVHETAAMFLLGCGLTSLGLLRRRIRI